MSRRRWAVGLGIPCAVLIACAVEDVRASSYDQGCKQNEDCMVIFEIVSNGGKCTQPCAAINKRDEDAYDSDIQKELHDCTSVEKGECHGAAICQDGRCAVEGGGIKDAGPG